MTAYDTLQQQYDHMLPDDDDLVECLSDAEYRQVRAEEAAADRDYFGY